MAGTPIFLMGLLLSSWINMVNDFQEGSLSTRLGIPMIYGIDAVHGHNNVYKATIFPHNIGLGATRSYSPLHNMMVCVLEND
ncbi:lysosomal beta glucosidase-like [Pyrus ussuriensis x Pyrus communis]|uniref:Lysosomal beta glucosidase-like n=1 Tax=Pyrus ussuriensis x Pyrus communis TaxID=2448454 RepID=A0A5N5G1U9_9ROSA|nr:lysosomal beta glucosidase-like [Pyrus ussuriensis x Pyrus communis]